MLLSTLLVATLNGYVSGGPEINQTRANHVYKGVSRKFFRRRGAMEKTRLKNNTINLPSTLSVLCMKIQ